MSQPARLLAATLCLLMAGPAFAAPQDVVLENDYARYVIGPDGRNRSLVDKKSGKDYCAVPGKRPLVTLSQGGTQGAPTACSAADGKITVRFQKPDVTVVLKATPRKHYFVFEVESVSDPQVEALALLNLAVTCSADISGMSGMAADNDFAACVRVVNLQGRLSLGGNPATFTVRCDGKHGLAGAKLVLAACPRSEIRPVLQEALREEGAVWSPLGGPFALDAPENRGSYVFASVSEKNVDEWIALAKKAGLAQIHLNGWAHSLGHYEPRKGLFPNGLAGLKATVDKIHAAGLKAGMHTLTGCISPHDPWVTPVPDKRLAADARFTLAAGIDAKAAIVPTAEQPQEFDTVWAYAAHGNVVRIDDELIQFAGLARQEPFGFTKCRRGAFGTKAAPHAKGAAVDHLFVRYGAFQPDENSTLVDDVAAQIAGVFNTCGFDMIYMDGAEGMVGGWHGVAKMRRAIFQKINRRVLVEASSWGYPSWTFHSRIGAWDYPNWALKRFIDIHCRANERYRRTALLPAELGWWAIFGPNRNRDAELPDELEYLCTKSLAYDMPMSFQAVHPGQRPQNARQDEYLEMIGRYERLRLGGHVAKSVRERLREEGAEFRLVRAADGRWQFVPTDYAVHKVTALDDPSSTWTVTNRFGAQPVKLRVQALYSVQPYDGPEGVVLASFEGPGEFPATAAAPGVTCSLARSTDQVKAGGASGRLSATSKAKSRRGAWAKMGKKFDPNLDLHQYGALGVWVHGDGKGELLNLQLTNPRQYWHCLDEHYVTVDFTGWRYFELLLRERDAEQFGRHQWPYSGHYAVYRSPLVSQHTSELNLYVNELPPGQEVACYLSPVKALKTAKVTLRNPAVQIGGRRIVFPVEVPSGGYLELESPSECRLYDERGALVEKVEPQGDVPQLAAGANQVHFTCQGPEGLRARARVTVISCGEPFGSAGGK